MARHKQNRWRKSSRWILLGVILFLIALRLALPPIGLWAINRSLATKLDKYTGQLADFDLSLYRGAYQLQGLEIKKKNSQLPPLLQVKEIDLSLAWRAIWDVWMKNDVSADITLIEARIHLLDDKKAENKQFGTDEDNGWGDVLDVLIPMKIETLTVRNSAVYFNHGDIKTPLPVRIEGLDFQTLDLRSRPRRNKKALSAFSGKATIQGHAMLETKGGIDLVSRPERLDLDLKIEGFEMNSINTYLRHYVPLDITQGKLNLYVETAGSREDLKGYAKVFLSDLDIIAHKQEYVSVKHFAYELLSAFGGWVLKNSKSRNVASYVPFEQKKNSFNVDTSEAFWSSVENMWARMPKGFDHSIELDTGVREVPKKSSITEGSADLQAAETDPF